MLEVGTVWVSRDAKGNPSFDVWPPSGGLDAGKKVERVVITNDLSAFRALDVAVVSAVDLLRLAWPLKLHDGFPETGAEALFKLWKRIERELLTLPHWALSALARLFHDMEEPGACLLFRNLAERTPGEEGEKAFSVSFPQTSVARANRRLPEPEDCVPVPPERAAGYFSPGGAFARIMAGYESRSGQVSMSRAVAEAFNDSAHLLVEAGTGVGKSLAYLVPAACWALENNVPVIISTNTRNLQQQLMEKDIPLLRKALAEGGADAGESEARLKAVLLKGRGNYLCLRNFAALTEQAALELDRPELRLFAETIAWAARTRDGDLDAFAGAGRADPAFFSKLSCSGEECAGRSCRFYRRCFLQKARAAASSAHLVLANHALVFAEAEMPGSILPPYAQIVFDEAHNLEDAATRHLSIDLSFSETASMLRRIYQLKGQRGKGALETVKRQVESGVVAGTPEAIAGIIAKLGECEKLIEKTRQQAKKFFDVMCSLAPSENAPVRFRNAELKNEKPIGVSSDGAYIYPRRRETAIGSSFAPASANWDEQRAQAELGKLLSMLASAIQGIDASAKAIDGCRKADELPLNADLVATLQGQIKTIQQFSAELQFVFASADEGHVFWAQPFTRMGTRQVSLHAAPLSIGPRLADLLYKQKQSVVFSSATLRVGSSFNFISSRLGLGLIDKKRLRTCLAESPFDYSRQCISVASNFMPEPQGNAVSGAYVEQLSALMLDVFRTAKGRSLGLFTSYEMMKQTAAIISEPLSREGIRLLVHNIDGTREQITHLFRDAFSKNAKPCVLFGVQSFWEGVDIPGGALSCVVIAKLPFAALGDPVTEARCEKIKSEGGSAFRDFSLPQAVIKFRQGFGRLVRTKSDTGAVVVADPRILRKSYGRIFAASLPCKLHAAGNREELLSTIGGILQNT